MQQLNYMNAGRRSGIAPRSVFFGYTGTIGLVIGGDFAPSDFHLIFSLGVYNTSMNRGKRI